MISWSLLLVDSVLSSLITYLQWKFSISLASVYNMGTRRHGQGEALAHHPPGNVESVFFCCKCCLKSQ